MDIRSALDSMTEVTTERRDGVRAYRILFFDSHGRLSQTAPMHCTDDDDALERLARSRHPHALELWHEDRLVWRFEDGPLV